MNALLAVISVMTMPTVRTPLVASPVGAGEDTKVMEPLAQVYQYYNKGKLLVFHLTKACDTILQWNLHIKDMLGSVILSFVGRLSSFKDQCEYISIGYSTRWRSL